MSSYCLKTKCIIENTLKKSRFIGITTPCNSVQNAQHYLKLLAEQYPDASHIVYAYRIKTDNGILYRFYDAGEPSGTAGKPLFQHLEGKNLINLIIVVIRYFGGIKLGAGGLTRAYSNTARDVLEAAVIEPYIELKSIHLTIDYHQLQSLEFLLKKLGGTIIEHDFSGQIQLLIQLPEHNTTSLLQSFPSNR